MCSMFSSVMSGVVLQEALQLMTNLEFDQNVCRTETGGSKHGSVSSYITIDCVCQTFSFQR